MSETIKLLQERRVHFNLGAPRSQPASARAFTRQSARADAG